MLRRACPPALHSEQDSSFLPQVPVSIDGNPIIKINIKSKSLYPSRKLYFLERRLKCFLKTNSKIHNSDQYVANRIDLSSKWASLIAQLIRNLPATQETRFDSWVGRSLEKR